MLAFGTQKKKQADGNDDERFDHKKKTVGQKEGYKDAKSEGERGNADQLSE